MPTLAQLMVADPQTHRQVPRDGKTIGEVMLRGNTVMKGYLKNEAASATAFREGWYHTGDLGVWHPDNYIEIKDRSKDIIVSGGENISSLEVEECLYRHPQVMEAAVVARPGPKWGETPCAVVCVKPDSIVTEKELIELCATRLGNYKRPGKIVLQHDPLPKTPVGKIKRKELREPFWSGHARRVAGT